MRRAVLVGVDVRHGSRPSSGTNNRIEVLSIHRGLARIGEAIGVLANGVGFKFPNQSFITRQRIIFVVDMDQMGAPTLSSVMR